MKKIFTIFVLGLIVLSGKIYAQSNITWTFTDPFEKHFFKSRTEFNMIVTGLNDDKAATAMHDKIVSNKDVAACTPFVKNAAGGYTTNLKMVKAQDGHYFMNWAEKIGVTYFSAGGKTKSLAELLAEQNKTDGSK